MSVREADRIRSAVARAERFCSREKAIQLVALNSRYSIAEVRTAVEGVGVADLVEGRQYKALDEETGRLGDAFQVVERDGDGDVWVEDDSAAGYIRGDSTGRFVEVSS